MTSKHTAKRIVSGEYQYRGYAISKIESSFGMPEGQFCYEWFIAELDPFQRCYFDPMPTLRSAKAAIDEYRDIQEPMEKSA